MKLHDPDFHQLLQLEHLDGPLVLLQRQARFVHPLFTGLRNPPDTVPANTEFGLPVRGGLVPVDDLRQEGSHDQIATRVDTLRPDEQWLFQLDTPCLRYNNKRMP
jgi:hypothetical protein